jgi:hypothetical protein
VLGQLAQLGQALPAKVVAVEGSIVTVGFLVSTPYTIQNVTMPIAGPEWARAPTQIGDRGVCIPASVYIGGVSGLGGGQATLTPRGNLSTLIFFPVGNVNFSATDNPNSYVLYGPDGVILRDSNSQSKFTLTPTQITANAQEVVIFEVGGINITVTAAGIVFNGPTVFNGLVSGRPGGGGVVNFGSATLETTGPAQVGSVASTGDVVAGAISVQNHVHSGIEPGGSNTGPAQG